MDEMVKIGVLEKAHDLNKNTIHLNFKELNKYLSFQIRMEKRTKDF